MHLWVIPVSYTHLDVYKRQFQLGDAYELVSYDRIQVTVTEKGPSADSTAASTDESQEGTESETSEGPAGTSKAEPGQ